MNEARAAFVFVLITLAAASARAEKRHDPRYGPECYEGAPRSDENLDCPLPLRTGGDDDRWDDLFVWGLTLRTGYAAPSMGGLGVAVRYFPARYVAFETGADVFGGVDPDGHRRTELPLSLDALLFFYRGSTLHGYLLGGAGVSFARIQYEPERIERESYFGPRLGAGIQVKGARDLGWGFDLVGFERTELSGDTSSVGALLRASLTIYPHD